MNITFASKTVLVSERLAETAGLRAGMRVLDLATGHGNTALAAARRGCEVTGIDQDADLLAVARGRAEAESLTAKFEVGDATALPYPDEHFDMVLSTFGVIDPSNRAAIHEAKRVGRLKLAFTVWAPWGAWKIESTLLGQLDYSLFEGDSMPDVERELTQSLQAQITHLVPRQVCMYAPTIAHYVEEITPLMGIDRYNADDQAEIKAAWAEGFAKLNLSGDDTLILPYDYLEVVAAL